MISIRVKNQKNFVVYSLRKATFVFWSDLNSSLLILVRLGGLCVDGLVNGWVSGWPEKIGIRASSAPNLVRGLGLSLAIS